jgi:YbgC/YbaW family acyl-CoA thioester hydrolase
MERKLSCELKVRSYELDGFGHVNHAVFLNYYEYARVEYLEQHGLSFASLWDEGYLFVIAKAEVEFLKPLTTLDRIEITGVIDEFGSSSVRLRQEMHKLPGGELVSRGKFVAVFLDRKTQQPTQVSESFRRAFLSDETEKKAPGGKLS